jgi:iron complex transport system ATP-binding protein
MMIEATAVTVKAGSVTLVDGVSLTVAPGELLAIAGPNGAGKSTLLGALAGDITPSSGTVRLGGEALPALRGKRLALRRAVLPQRVELAFPFTAAEVVHMGRAPHPPGDDDEVVGRCMAETDTLHLADRAFPTLSGGEQARVALARVLAQDTPVLLLDEPTAALDLRHQEQVLSVASARAAAGCAVVVVLHDLNLAAAYADRVCLLAGGRLAACAPPDQVLRSDLLGDIYGHPVTVRRVDDDLVILPRRAGGHATDE